MSWWPFRRRRESPQRRRQLAIAGLPFDLPRRLAKHVAAEAEKLGLVFAGEGSGSSIIAEPGKVMALHHDSCWVPATESAIYETATAMIRQILHKHGPGRVWTLPNLELVFPVYDDGMLVWLDEHGEPAIKLVAKYYHAADARPIAPPDPEAA